MSGLILDGKALSQAIEADLSVRVQKIKERNAGRSAILATILVGDDPASATYVKMKGAACRRVGMESLKVVMPEATTTVELLAKIDELNADTDVQGILLQHPVPRQIDERACFERIALAKDVDGVTMLGFGRMAMGEPAYGSATPAGIMRLLAHYKIPLEGRHAVVIGRSPILGKPVSLMLLNVNATVTICHSKPSVFPSWCTLPISSSARWASRSSSRGPGSATARWSSMPATTRAMSATWSFPQSSTGARRTRPFRAASVP